MTMATKVDQEAFEELRSAPVVTRAKTKQVKASTSCARKGRQALRPMQTNTLHFSSGLPASNAVDPSQSQAGLQALLQVCDGIDREVAARSAAIRAIASAQLSSIKTQMACQLSSFPSDIQNMALEEYVKSCPGIEAVTKDDGRVQLQKASPYATLLRSSKKNLHDCLSNATDNLSGDLNSSFYAPAFVPPSTSGMQRHLRTVEKQDVDQNVGNEVSWPEYIAQLQAMGHTTGFGASIGSYQQQHSAMGVRSTLMRGVTPKTLRLPKHGEVLLSMNGSPLWEFGLTPGPDTDFRLRSTKPTEIRKRRYSKRSLRDL